MTFSLTDLPLPIWLRTEKPMTDDELMRFCAMNECLRVERDANGELIVMSPTGLEGSSSNSEVNADLTIWARGDGRGKVFDSNGGFTLNDGSMRSPDAAWVSGERWNALSAAEKGRFGHVTPEFIIELRSKTDRLPDLQAKMQMWIANGVELAWLIDPERKVMEIYRPGEPAEIHQNPTSIQGTGPICGFELILQRIWG